MRKIFYLLFLGGGLAICAFGLRGCYYAGASLHWPVTEGIVTESRISRSRGGNRTTYSPEVRYRYQIDGRVYDGDRIYFSGIDLSSNHDYALDITARYAVGRVVEVYHHPRDPELAVLQPGIRRETIFTFVIGGAFAAFALLGFYLDHRGRSRHRTKHRE